MNWTAEQRAALEREYNRIGYRQGERWPAPPQDHAPEALLDLLRSVATGAGVQGYIDALKALRD
jgi:hypothetical protein